MGAKAFDPATVSARGGCPRALTFRGVTYDTGIDMGGGERTRKRWTRALMQGELDAIRNGLHCNAVSITGTETHEAECLGTRHLGRAQRPIALRHRSGDRRRRGWTALGWIPWSGDPEDPGVVEP